jgi:hypothetical protein
MTPPQPRLCQQSGQIFSLHVTKKHQEALNWLAEHRREYAAHWLALEGSQLLASGKTAREVYDRVRVHNPHALIVKVEAEDLPFAGW